MKLNPDCVRDVLLGHEFLNSIRGEKVWDKVKSFSKNAGSTSLEIIKNIAISTATSIAMQYLNN